MATAFTKPAPVAGPAQGVLVILAGFLPILAIVALTPAVPNMVGHFAGLAGATTLVPLGVTAPGLMIALFSPVMGWLADRYGRRVLLIWATFIYGFVGVAPYFLESLAAIFATRLALGLCEAAILTITNTLIADYYPEAGRRNWLMAQAAFGPIFGVTVLIGSGQLAAFDWHLPFLIYAVALPIAGAMAIWLFEPAHARISSTASSETFPTRHIAVCGGVTLFGASLYYVYIVQIGLAFEGIGLHAADKVGMLVGLANIGVFLGGLAFKPLSIRLGVAGQIAAFLGFMGAGMLGIGFAADIATMTGFAMIEQFGAGILIPALVLWAMQGVAPQHRGRAMGIWSACFFLGQFTSPLAVSLVRLSGAGIGGAFAWLGGLAVICAGVAVLRAR
ncbi:MFS transporter [Novosphingobium sp. SG707]|uniref:MFS transporter n=1 Tax=Novosphingobium sp. SG707 TaxID=2586996 RepID=UPI00144741AA|nr:MFS transporter [Novosphingobium sp. SG707]NKI98507.1 MFS family permease [Novosphingobium sp. SG707]